MSSKEASGDQGNQLRVSAQLIDAATDAHLWAERFDRDIGDLFALQNEITSLLANALGVELIAAEAARPAEHPDALDYILRGRAALLNLAKPDAYNEAVSLFTHALALAPQSGEVQSWLAAVLVARVLNGMTDTATSDLARADVLIGQALAVSPRSSRVHFVKGNLLRAQRRYAEAIPEYETALALNRNLLVALNGLAWSKLLSAGSIEEAVLIWEQAVRLSPRDPFIGHWCASIGFAHLLRTRNDGAILWLERARGANERLPFVHAWLASAYAQRGETDRAAGELAEARRLDCGDLFSSIAHLKAYSGAWWGEPKVRALFEATYFAGLRKAGMPEE